jgi:methyl-accepting chemotaxis protein
MKTSIQTKLLIMCIFLVFLTAAGISITYYILARQDKQRESRQRIRIAFDIILDDMTDRLNVYTRQFDEFLRQNSTTHWTTHGYNKNKEQITSLEFVISYLSNLAQDFKNFGYISAIDHLLLYTTDNRLLLAYNRHAEQDAVGAYLISGTGENTYFPIGDTAAISSMMLNETSIPDHPLPEGISPVYERAIPGTISSEIVHDGRKLLFRITAPVYHQEDVTGVIVGEVFFTQDDVDQYASLSKTDINLFAGSYLSVGTLAAQTELEPETLSQKIFCNRLLNTESNELIEMISLIFDNHQYYQSQCVLTNALGEHSGAITVSLSQELEKQGIKRTVTVVLMISGIAIGIAFILSVIFSRRTIQSIQNIVNVIGSASEGDLRQTAAVRSKDELGMLAQKLNQMISQLRGVSGQVQKSSNSVGVTADMILREIETLTKRIGQQSTSVDNTTESAKRINQFISTIGDDTTELLSAAEQILSSIHESRASRQEVTKNIGYLAENLQLILGSVEQVNSSAKQVTGNIEHLDTVSRQTETEMQHIDQSFKDVSENADLSQQLARETQEAALSGQESVKASIQGMVELKEAVSNTAQIIQEVNSWSEQVNSILDIVDNITEQTSLLALNASIISAQAGSHGRGFAVVAEEIKELAMRTRNSTQEIASLLHALQQKTEDGVKHTTEGLKKADSGMQLANTVKESLDTILERATRSSDRAASTAQVVQNTVASSQIISTSMSSITAMVSQIRTAIQDQERDISQVVEAVENSQAMSEQINHSSIEQNQSSGQIEQSMELVTDKLSNISHQTEQLTQNSEQIVEAMHAIDEIAENILQEITIISGKTANDLVNQSKVLQGVVNVFKVS